MMTNNFGTFPSNFYDIPTKFIGFISSVCKRYRNKYNTITKNSFKFTKGEKFACCIHIISSTPRKYNNQSINL